VRVNANERDEITASVAAHAELGPRYDDAVAEGLVERIGEEIDRRIDARLGGGAGPRRGQPGSAESTRAQPTRAQTVRLPETERLAPAYHGPSEPAPATPFAVPAVPRRAGGLSGVFLGLGSLGIGIGATAIVMVNSPGAFADLLIILVIWAAIAVINVAHSQRR
jgi:hypothetical protein